MDGECVPCYAQGCASSDSSALFRSIWTTDMVEVGRAQGIVFGAVAGSCARPLKPMSVRGQCLVIFTWLLGALLLASLIALLLRLRFRAASARPVLDNLAVRIKAWWVMVIVVGGVILAGRQAVIGLFAFVSLAALREFITLTPTRRADYGALFLSFFVVLPMQYGLYGTSAMEIRWQRTHGQSYRINTTLPELSMRVL